MWFHDDHVLGVCFAFFYKGVKRFISLFAGIVLFYILNLFRIYVLNVIVVDFPALTKPAHDYFFPAIIYGGVVVLWLIWINKFVITMMRKILNWLFVFVGILGINFCTFFRR